jgi:hypothetical protein
LRSSDAVRAWRIWALDDGRNCQLVFEKWSEVPVNATTHTGSHRAQAHGVWYTVQLGGHGRRRQRVRLSGAVRAWRV